MRIPSWFSIRTALVVVFVGLLLVPPGAVLVAWTGIYNVAANHGHPAWLNWFLEMAMTRSVTVNASKTRSPPLDEPGMVALGAAHFQGGCAPCHAAPGQLINPVYGGMLPQPPRLENEVTSWKDYQLRWIVYHGLQYAGMPSWSGDQRDEEVWPIVAFLQRLPGMTEDQYRRLALRSSPAPDYSATQIIQEGTSESQLAVCARCHEAPGLSPISDRVPRLAGQSPAYLARALQNYRADKRQSGIMEPVASQLGDAAIADLASWYASLPRQPPAVGTSDPALVALGRQIAEEGVPIHRIAACNSCHGPDARQDYPRLAGQPAEYIRMQLELFRSGVRDQTPSAQVMAEVAGNLGDRQIAAVAAYFQSVSQ